MSNVTDLHKLKDAVAREKPQPNIIENNALDFLSHGGLFEPEHCAEIISQHSPQKWTTASVVAGSTEHTKLNKEVRDSKTNYIMPEDDMPLLQKCHAIMTAANNAHFQFDVDFFEGVQLACYDPGMHYDWHFDMGHSVIGNRKLSMTVQLSDPDSYEGGDLLFQMTDPEPVVAPRDIGSVTIFPSFIRHRVTPVTSGVRYSLVLWASGTYRFK